MRTQKELKNDLNQLKKLIDDIVYNYSNHDTLEVEYDKFNADEQQNNKEFSLILDKLMIVSENLEYLNTPIVAEGFIQKNVYGKYELITKNYSHTYSCGCIIEFLSETETYNDETEQYEDVNIWRTSRVEHDMEDYYILYNHKRLDGLYVRVREKQY